MKMKNEKFLSMPIDVTSVWSRPAAKNESVNALTLPPTTDVVICWTSVVICAPFVFHLQNFKMKMNSVNLFAHVQQSSRIGGTGNLSLSALPLAADALNVLFLARNAARADHLAHLHAGGARAEAKVVCPHVLREIM
jgi:hypothetical protein